MEGTHFYRFSLFIGFCFSSDKSRSSQSILMDMSANPTPPSSQDRTMAIFGMGSQVKKRGDNDMNDMFTVQ